MDFGYLMGVLMVMLVPGIFVLVGATLIWKSGKELYKWSFRYKKVMANCVEIQQIRADKTTLYRPVFEYMENGRVIRAYKLDYEYQNKLCVGNTVPITVESKHPDVVMEIGKEYNLDQEYLNVVVGIFMLIVSLPVMLSTILMYATGIFFE